MSTHPDTDQRLALVEITESDANAAVRVIAANATDRADLLLLLDMVRPTPHHITDDPAHRRAQPRFGDIA